MRQWIIAALIAGGTAHAAEFEVASVKPHVGNMSVLHTMTISGPRVRLQGYTIEGLVEEAYSVRHFQLVLSDEVKRNTDLQTFYDIEARVAGDRTPSISEARLMLQPLLSQRFHARVHRGSKELAVYGLVAAKSGPKLKESAPDAECGESIGVSGLDGRVYTNRIVGCPIQTLVERAGNLVDRPVVDRTGLTGKYDVSLIATPMFMTEKESGPGDVSPFAALQDLGFRLEPMKAVLGIVSLDGFDKVTEN